MNNKQALKNISFKSNNNSCWLNSNQKNKEVEIKLRKIKIIICDSTNITELKLFSYYFFVREPLVVVEKKYLQCNVRRFFYTIFQVP